MRHDWATRAILAVTHIVGLEHVSSSLHIQKNDTVFSVTHGSQIPSDICKRLTCRAHQIPCSGRALPILFSNLL